MAVAPLGALARRLLVDLVDLVVPQVCAGCSTRGPVLCPSCAATLTGPGRAARPDPCPPGLPPGRAAAAYGGPVRTALVAHKEDAVLALTRPLGAALARSVAAAVPGTGPLLLVPVPSRRAVRRARGHDHTRRLAVAATVVLRRQRREVRVLPLLAAPRRVRDQAGLGATARAANLAGAYAARPGAAAAVLRAPPGAAVVLVDDVVTTGATLAEAARALRAAGVRPDAIAVVAATLRGTRRVRTA